MRAREKRCALRVHWTEDEVLRLFIEECRVTCWLRECVQLAGPQADVEPGRGALVPPSVTLKVQLDIDVLRRNQHEWPDADVLLKYLPEQPLVEPGRDRRVGQQTHGEPFLGIQAEIGALADCAA